MKSKSLWTQIAACTALALAGTAAQAELYSFTLTGDYAASWQLNSTVVPDVVDTDSYFSVWDVPGFPDAFLGIADITFYSATNGGGLAIDDIYGGNILVITDGPQLYTGTEDAPTFQTGTFALTEFGGAGVYTLTIAGVSVVPEPASIGLLLGGLGLVAAGAARRRKTDKVDEAAAA